MTNSDPPMEAPQAPPAAVPGVTVESQKEDKSKLGLRLRAFTLSEGNLFLLLAVVIGLLSGMAVVCFRICIDWIHWTLLGSGLAPSHARTLIVPAATGLLVAFFVQRLFRGANGSGVNQTKAA